MLFPSFLLLLARSIHALSIRRTLLDPYPGKPRITFGVDGTFKLSVFSDLHFGENEEGPWGPEQDANSLRVMRRVLADERPQYVVLNGDLITGENTFRENSTDYINIIIGPLNDAKVPFSSTHGNHDNQANITHAEEIARENVIAPLSYTRAALNGVGGTQGEGNYWVPVYANNMAKTPTLVLWFFDSRGGFSPGPNSTRLPDWVDASVADWIIAETKAMEQAWGPAQGRGALAFVHIPPHHIEAVQRNLDNTTNPGLNEDRLGRGSTQDSETQSADDPFWNALTSIPNLHALVSGHDHGNEWCAREPSRDTVFCFDKHSGYGGYGQPWWGYGVRNFLFEKRDGREPPVTWIRLEEGEVKARVRLGPEYGRGQQRVEL